jgi:naphthoate synthase
VTARFSDSSIVANDEGPIRWLTLNRPDHGNAMTRQMLITLREQLEDAREDRSVRVIVLTGAGDKFFCIGAEKGEASQELDYSTVTPIVDLYQLIDQLPKPVIAAVNGYAVGGGHVLHVMCDLTVAKDSAIFRQVGPLMGSFDAGYGTWYLEDLVGRKRAKELWFLNEKLTASRAFDLGLVNFVVPSEQFRAETSRIANAVAQRGSQALSAVKLSFAARTGGTGGFARIAHDLLLRHYLTSEESAELSQSFNEKRPPDTTRFGR